MLKSILALVMFISLSGCALVSVKSPTKSVESQKSNLESYIGKRAVMLVAQGGSGSGVILKSTKRGSIIMTNMHVCKPLQKLKGFVLHNNRQIPISHYKISKVHDICIVRVRQNLGLSTKLADSSPRKYDILHTAGHPRGEPLTINNGVMTERVTISVTYAYVPCKSLDEHPDCLMYGDRPIIRNMDSSFMSAMSAPGSSGSGVFNSKGELVGLVFAGYGNTFSPSYNVPYEYIVEFLEEEQYKLKWGRHKKAKTNKSNGVKYLQTPQVLGISK